MAAAAKGRRSFSGNVGKLHGRGVASDNALKTWNDLVGDTAQEWQAACLCTLADINKPCKECFDKIGAIAQESVRMLNRTDTARDKIMSEAYESITVLKNELVEGLVKEEGAAAKKLEHQLFCDIFGLAMRNSTLLSQALGYSAEMPEFTPAIMQLVRETVEAQVDYISDLFRQHMKGVDRVVSQNLTMIATVLCEEMKEAKEMKSDKSLHATATVHVTATAVCI